MNYVRIRAFAQVTDVVRGLVSVSSSRRFIALLIVQTILIGCASPYIAPSVSPPPTWQGPSGFGYKSRKVHEGTHHSGGVIAESELTLRRTGTIVATVQTKDAFGKALIIPQGTKVFATNYTLNRNGASVKGIDPIEWCAVLPNGVDGQQSGRQTVCIFWEAPDRARYIANYDVGAFPFSGRLPAEGVPGPVPTIDDTPVDLGIRVRSTLRVARLDSKNVVLQRLLTDGTAEELDEQRALVWPLQPPLIYGREYGVLEIVPTNDYRSVTVREQRQDRRPARSVEHAHVPVAIDYGRPCGAPASDEELSGTEVIPPRFTPQYPPLQPNYPNDSRKRSEQGTIEMLLLVNEKGDVSQAKVLKSTGYAALDQSGLAAARDWKLAPGTVHGKSRCVWQSFKLSWGLAD